MALAKGGGVAPAGPGTAGVVGTRESEGWFRGEQRRDHAAGSRAFVVDGLQPWVWPSCWACSAADLTSGSLAVNAGCCQRGGRGCPFLRR